MLYTNSKNFDKVLEVAKELNKKTEKELDENEVIKIAKSVYKYNIENKNKIYGWKVKANYNLRSMEFEKISNLPYKNYLKEVRRRQKMAGKERGKKNLIKRNTELANATKEKVYKAIQLLKEKEEKITIKKVENLAQVSYLSARKYVKQAREEGLI